MAEPSGTAGMQPAPTGLFGAIVEPVLKASIAYIPASLIVCGALASLGQRALFGLSLDSFEVNSAVATGLDFFADVAGGIVEYLLSAGWGTYIAGAAAVIVAAILVRWRRVFGIQLLIVLIVALTGWRIWTIDLPATFLSNVFSFDPRVLVQSNHSGKLLTSGAAELWHSVVCQYAPGGIEAEKGPSGDVRPAIKCDKAQSGLDQYRKALLIALVTIVIGLIVIAMNPTAGSTGSVYRAFVITLITYQLLATPFLYGRLKMDHDFPEVDLYLRSARAELPADVAPFQAVETTKSKKPSWPWLHAYLLERKEKSLTLLVPIPSSCGTIWRRIELNSSEVTLVRNREFKQDERNTLFAQFLRASRACKFEAPPPQF